MPMDPFFSSANKKHYIENPEHTALLARVRAMTDQERGKWMHAMKWKPWRDRSASEASVYRALVFEWNMRNHARNRFHGEQYAYDLRIAAVRTHTVVMHGQNTAGGHRSQCQVSAHKASHNQQGAPRHLERVYNPKHKNRHASRLKP